MKQPRKAKRRRRWLFVVPALVVLATVAGWYYFNYYAVAKEPAEPTLQTAKVRTGDITITASGNGNLLPASELDLAFRSGGMLAEMLIQVGDEVEAGQILARLDDADAQAQVAQAEANLRLAELKLAELTQDANPATLASARATLAAAQADLTRLTAPPTDGENLAAQASLASAQADLTKLTAPPTDQELLATQENLKSAQGKLGDLLAGPDPEQLKIAQANLTLAEMNLRTAQTAYDKVAHKENVGATREAADLWQATTNYEKTLAEYEEVLAGPTVDEISDARSQVAQAQAQLDALLEAPDPDALAAARAKVAQAQAQLDALQEDPDLDDLTAAEAKVTQAQAQLDDLLAGSSAEDLEAAEVNVSLARYSLENAQRQVENTLLRAPAAGTIITVQAQAGEPVGTASILTLADLETPLVRFWVEETDLISVAPGNLVEVIFEALPDYVFPGQIARVDPALVTVDGTPAVQVWASVDLSAHPVTLLSGMTTEVEIIAGEAHDALLVPVQALRELAPGSYAVFVVQSDGELTLRPVTVGLKDFANAEILAGLERGEIVSTGTVDTE